MDQNLWHLVHTLRRELEQNQTLEGHLCCMTSSAALSLLLSRMGYSPQILEGRIVVDRPAALDPDEPTESDTSIAHHWVEVDGWWLDLTADQFNPYVSSEPYPPVRIIPAGSDPRYTAWRPANPEAMLEIQAEDPGIRKSLRTMDRFVSSHLSPEVWDWLGRLITDTPGNFYRRPFRWRDDWPSARALVIGEQPKTEWKKTDVTLSPPEALNEWRSFEPHSLVGDRVESVLFEEIGYPALMTNVVLYAGSLEKLPKTERSLERQVGLDSLLKLIRLTSPVCIFLHGSKALGTAARHFRAPDGTRLALSIHTPLTEQEKEPVFATFPGVPHPVRLLTYWHLSGGRRKSPDEVASAMKQIGRLMRTEITSRDEPSHSRT